MSLPGVPVLSLRRLFPDMVRGSDREFSRIAGMMALFFLVVCAVGILRPIKNTLALNGLGATDFYEVYLVSAGVVLFVPPYNRLSDRFPWRWLIPGVALFFALHLVLFRIFYQDKSAIYGMLFYGWYDLFAAALVTQFFMATQLFFNARDAKRAYPLVIGGGAIGATLGGAITGFFAQRVGTPNLLLVAAALIAAFGIGLPIVWAGDTAIEQRKPKPKRHQGLSTNEFLTIFRDPQVQLIAASVLLTILVKQLVDYQYNVLTKDVFHTRDAMSAFQGKFNAATQWLPLVVLAGLRPLLKRWGVSAAVLLLPVAMLLSNMGLALWFGLATAVVAKGSDAALRYSAERTGREILYVPVPDAIKLKAKTYIDVAIEKGIGKVSSAGLIFVLLSMMSYRRMPFVAVGLSVLWLAVALLVRREYVRTLERSFQGRFASLRGVFASLADMGAIPAVRRALSSGNPLQAAFALDLLGQAEESDIPPLAADLTALLGAEQPELREHTLDLLTRSPEVIDVAPVRALLRDPIPAVREAAVRALCAARPDEAAALLQQLMEDPDPAIRLAALACVSRGDVRTDGTPLVTPGFIDARWKKVADDATARAELAMALGALGDGTVADRYLEVLVDDADPGVARAALLSAGRLHRARFYSRLISALGRAATRAAARNALVEQGQTVVPLLAEALRDEQMDLAVRRNVPPVLAAIGGQTSLDVLLDSLADPETDQLLDFRTLKALNKLRARSPELAFDAETVLEVCRREAERAARYNAARKGLAARGGADGRGLLGRALEEAFTDRRESVFRCIGLIRDPDAVRQCYLAVMGGSKKARASALEWLERQIGHSLYSKLEPVIEGDAGGGRRAVSDIGLDTLRRDKDRWIAHCAAETDVDGGRMKARGETMELIEKVFLLQGVDLLQGAKTSHLALVASVAEEVEAAAGEVLLRQGEPTDALYVIVRGALEVRDASGQTLELDKGAVGTWALIDESPCVVDVRVAKPSSLLRISRGDFYDLLTDNPELGVGLLQGLARRMRALVA
jgi:ATP:ADP antiporter, AAA family